MQSINYNTKKLIVINYPGGAGGKFIAMCLALSDDVLYQHPDLANKKINGNLNSIESYQAGLRLLKSSKNNVHSQFNDDQFAGFNDGHSIDEQNNSATVLWKTLTNQNKYWFIMTSHFGNQWKHYPNAYNIIIKNYEFILKDRQKHLQEKRIFEEHFTDKNRLLFFDQSSVKNKQSLKDELSKLIYFFKMSEPNWDHIEQFRKYWLSSLKIGF